MPTFRRGKSEATAASNLWGKPSKELVNKPEMGEDVCCRAGKRETRTVLKDRLTLDGVFLCKTSSKAGILSEVTVWNGGVVVDLNAIPWSDRAARTYPGGIGRLLNGGGDVLSAKSDERERARARARATRRRARESSLAKRAGKGPPVDAVEHFSWSSPWCTNVPRGDVVNGHGVTHANKTAHKDTPPSSNG
ncbi:hypothetical protein Bbelb_143190 [Branchiostoma belcheri]|nr:hypothetical protein Bbelb_143190 [Branchiostoma belcheri]